MNKKAAEGPYPAWICSVCAEAMGGHWPEGHVGTFHLDICDVCGLMADVTEPRDYGHFTPQQIAAGCNAAQQRKGGG